jgi:hypothetical protein
MLKNETPRLCKFALGILYESYSKTSYTQYAKKEVASQV